MFGTVKVKNKKTGQWVAVDAVKGQQYDSGWVTFKEWDGETADSGDFPLQCRRVAKTVYIRGSFRFDKSLFSDRVGLGRLPESFRPSQDIRMITDCLTVVEHNELRPIFVRCSIDVDGYLGAIIVPASAYDELSRESGYIQSYINCSYVVD